MSTITLCAGDLLHKFGFGDGDILEGFWDELEVEGFSPLDDGLLESVVERYLVPLLPAGSETYRMSSIHNPIRITYDDDDYEVMHAILAPISVEVTVEQVLAVARELSKGGSHAADPTP